MVLVLGFVGLSFIVVVVGDFDFVVSNFLGLRHEILAPSNILQDLFEHVESDKYFD